MHMDHSIRPDLLLSVEASGCGCDDAACDAGQLVTELDDKTISYVLETRPYFEDLRQSISQIAGLLVLATAGAKSVTQDHAMLEAARDACKRALDGIRSTRPTARATHHHRHLLEAAQDLGLAISRSGDGLHLTSTDRHRNENVFGPLEAAYRNLGWATRTLPGFEILSFDQACCAPQQVEHQQ